MSEIALQVDGLGKHYRIDTRQQRYGTLKDALVTLGKTPFLALAGKHARRSVQDFWALRDASFHLNEGTILGVIGFLRITVWSAFSDIYGPHWMLVAITVAFTLLGIVLWGTLVGSLLPFGLRRLGFDPAASSAPFVATLVDVTGLVIYFSVALFVLKGTLL